MRLLRHLSHRAVQFAAAISRLLLVSSATLVFIPTILTTGVFGSSRHVARVLRWYLQRCGGGFVKLGQLLSTRYDLLPAPYCAELAGLLDDAGAVESKHIVSAIEQGLGGELGSAFTDFNLRPLASASIAQVHTATIDSRIEVVVKVQRPGAAVMFAVDFAVLRLIAWLMDVAFNLGTPRFRNMVRESHAAVAEELDFRREARNCHRMRQLMRTDSVRHYAPRIFFSHSSDRVLTMERVRGVAVNDIITAIDNQDHDQLMVWADHGITPGLVARRLLRSVLTQTMRHRFFHSDPHPANLIVRADGSLAWVDFGMTGWMDDRTWSQQFRLRDAIARRELHRAYEALLDSLEPIPAVDLRGFEEAVESAMQDWIVASETPGASIAEKSSGFFLIRTFDAIRRAGLTMPPGLMRLYRTMMVADMVMLKLDPTINWVPMLRRFVDAETRRQARDWSSSPLIPSFVAALQGVLRIPGASIKLVDWLNARLPQYGRLYERQMSALDAGILAAVRIARGTAVFVVLAVIAMAVASTLGRAGETWQQYSSWRVPLAAGAAVVYLWSSLALRSFRR